MGIVHSITPILYMHLKHFKDRVMIKHYLKTQFFTTLPHWQDGPPLLFEFFLFFKYKLR
jgi:hypothetical protein